MCSMAHHYSGGLPGEIFDRDTDFSNLESENVSVPGSDDRYDLNFDLDPDEVIHNGEVVDADIAAGLSLFQEVMADYEEGDATLEVFLGYVENDWDTETLWRETDMSRDEVYDATGELSEEYGLIDWSFGDVDLTEDGENFHRTFEYLAEQT